VARSRASGPRILYLTPGCFDKGGISRYCRYQIRALRDISGPEAIRVVSLMGPGENSFEDLFEVAWHGPPQRTPWGKSQFACVAIATALAWRPHVIHVAHVNLTPLAAALAAALRARTVVNVYGLEIWSGLAEHRRRALRSMDLVIADCRFTAHHVVEARLHRAPPTVIWDCVDLDRFTPGACRNDVLDKYGIPDKRASFVVLTLGRLARGAAHKGYDRLIEAFERLRSRSVEAVLVIAGEGELRPELEALALRRGLADRVRFAGAIAEADLADVYRAATIFSLVSDRGRHRGEGLPLTPLEAMACGAPIIVGDQDGSPEAVVGGANGFVIDPFDTARHAAILEDVAQSPDLRARLSAGARRVAEVAFGFKEFRLKHLACYASLIADAAPAGDRAA
jgi:phosphatidyl-myo-inositol dimannoside synthase